LKVRKTLYHIRENEFNLYELQFLHPCPKAPRKSAKVEVMYIAHGNITKTMEVSFPFSHYRCIVTALKLPLFQSFLTERVTGNVRVVLTEMEFK
jgi:hypothetical protein